MDGPGTTPTTPNPLLLLSPPIVPVSLASIMIETFFYGLFFILFAASFVIAYNREAQETSQPMGGPARMRKVMRATAKRPIFLGTVGLFLSVTAHWICDVIRLFQGMAYSQSPALYYLDLSQTTKVTQTALLVISLAIGDSLIIFRLFVVWLKNPWIIVFPCLMLVGFIVSGIGITYEFSRFTLDTAAFHDDAQKWILCDGVFTLCVNVYCSGLIGWKIWSTSLRTGGRRFQARSLTSILGIFVESAAFYTAWAVFFMASYQSQSNLQFLTIDTIPSVAGIACMMINIRIALGLRTTPRSSSLRPMTTDTNGRVSRPVFALRDVEDDGEVSRNTDSVLLNGLAPQGHARSMIDGKERGIYALGAGEGKEERNVWLAPARSGDGMRVGGVSPPIGDV